jgi:hypothetical protein
VQARPRTSGSQLALYRRARKFRRAATGSWQRGSVAAWSSTAATTGFVRGHRAPATTNNRRIHRYTHHRCTRMCKYGPISHQCPGPVQPPRSSNYELDRPGCDTHPLRRDMYFATSVDKVVLTRCVESNNEKKTRATANSYWCAVWRTGRRWELGALRGGPRGGAHQWNRGANQHSLMYRVTRGANQHSLFSRLITRKKRGPRRSLVCSGAVHGSRLATDAAVRHAFRVAWPCRR